MKTSQKLFIASVIHKIMAIIFAFLGSFLHDLHRPPFQEMGVTSYYVAGGLGLTAIILGIVGLNWQASEDKERRLGARY